MNNATHDKLPQICFEVGLSCQDCVAGTAHHVASLCKGLRGKALGRLFVQIYPNPACSPMHAHFAEAYRAASIDLAHAKRLIADPLIPEPTPAFTRRELALPRPKTLTAAA